jgi:hypothetical protein
MTLAGLVIILAALAAKEEASASYAGRLAERFAERRALAAVAEALDQPFYLRPQPPLSSPSSSIPTRFRSASSSSSMRQHQQGPPDLFSLGAGVADDDKGDSTGKKNISKSIPIFRLASYTSFFRAAKLKWKVFHSGKLPGYTFYMRVLTIKVSFNYL